jgi:hypothetical protein
VAVRRPGGQQSVQACEDRQLRPRRLFGPVGPTLRSSDHSCGASVVVPLPLFSFAVPPGSVAGRRRAHAWRARKSISRRDSRKRSRETLRRPQAGAAMSRPRGAGDKEAHRGRSEYCKRRTRRSSHCVGGDAAKGTSFTMMMHSCILSFLSPGDIFHGAADSVHNRSCDGSWAAVGKANTTSPNYRVGRNMIKQNQF